MPTATSVRPSAPPPAPLRYHDVLKVPTVPRLLAGGIIGHLPVAMAPVALLLAVRATGGTIQLAGLLVAIYGLSAATGQPVLGRLLDCRGHRLALAASTACSSAAFLALTGIQPAQSPSTAATLACAAGLATPPTEAAIRASWPRLLSPPAQHKAIALDASAQELVYIAGPLLVLSINAIAGTTPLLPATAAIGAAGVALFLSAIPTHAPEPAPAALADSRRAGALRAPGTRALAAAMGGVGVAIGAVNIVAVTLAERYHIGALATLVPAALGVGSLTGGLAFGSRKRPQNRPGHLLAAAAGILLGLLPLLTDPTPLQALATVATAGLGLAPLLAMAFGALDHLALPGTTAESAAWLIASLGLGQSLGTAIAAAAPSPLSPSLIAVAGALLACGVLRSTRSCLSPRRTYVAAGRGDSRARHL